MHGMQGKWRGLILALGLAGAVSGCGGGGGGDSAPPVAFAIVEQPADQRVTAPAPATFSVRATGNNLTYQWLRNGIPIRDATTPSVPSTATDASTNGDQYSVIVTSGNQQIQSRSAILTVDIRPRFTSGPDGNAILVAPATATLTVVVAGSPAPTLQWQSSPDGLNWTDIPGATGTTYTTPPTTVADNGKALRVVATNAVGSEISPLRALSVSAPLPFAWQFGAPVPTTNASEGAQDMRLAADASGGFLAVWLQPDPTGPQTLLRSSRYSPQFGWSNPLTISAGDATGPTAMAAPQLAMTPAGDAIVLWRVEAVPSQLWSARFGSAGTWTSPARVSTPGYDGEIGGYGIALDGSRVATAVWSQARSVSPGVTERRLLAARDVPGTDTVAGTGWAELTDIDLGTGDAGATDTPQVSANGRGDVIVAWTGPQPSINAARYVAGAGWATAALLAGPAEGEVAQAGPLAIDASGAVVLAYSSGTATSSHAYVRTSASSAAGWLVPTAVDQSTSTAVATGLALGVDGSLAATWQQPGSGGQEPWVSRKSPGGAWSAPERLSSLALSTGSFQGTQPRICSDAAGTLISAWLDVTGNLASARLVIGGTWSLLPNLEGSSQAPAAGFALACNADGTAAAAWTENLPTGGAGKAWVNVAR